MRIFFATFVTASLLACGCESFHSGQSAIEPNALGISELEIHHDLMQGERVLTVRGLDAEGATVATAVLRTGMVMYGADMEEALHAGTELKLTVGDTTESFVSPDRVPHTIYETLSAGEASFVGLHAVANEIEQEAGIRFAPPKATAKSGELAYTAASCSGSRFPTNKGGANQCCQDTAQTWHVNTSNQVVNRSTYAPAYPSIPVCRDSSGNTGCTTNCMYGPCGVAIISLKGTNGHIFHPTSNPNVCGWDDGGAGGLGVDYNPEHYSSQTLYGGVTPTCGCTGCNADGTAQCSYSSIVLSDSPLSYWRFGEAAGATTVADETGAHAGTINGATLGEAGPIKNDPNTALRNVAADDNYVDIGDYYTFSGTAAFSIEAWVRPVSFNVPGGGSVIVSKIDRSGTWETGYYFGIQPSGNIALVRYNGAGVEDWCGPANSPLSLNVYSHVVATYDGATMRCYVNGTQVDSWASTLSIVAHTQPMHIGDFSDFGSAWDGQIDEVAIYGSALSLARIQAHYAAGDAQAPTAPTNLAVSVTGATSLNITWTASTDNVAVTGYKLERCKGASCSNFVQIATPTGTSYPDSGLTTNSTYRYRVRATDAATNLGGYSNIASGVPH